MAAAAKIPGLGPVAAVVQEEPVGMAESPVRFEAAREFVVVAVEAVTLAAG
ncbi:MAG: hypothetical protein P1S46_01430 [bacterium]|nr:hypothetical protein [bacterium]MDT8394929.1 hypothetical protein [bacterium]